MDPRAPRVRILALVREDLRALPRNVFALGAVGVVLAAFAPIAAFALEGSSSIRDMLVFTWLVAELVVAIVVAARVAAARRSRFVDSLYTTPLEQRTWLAAQAIVGMCLVALLLAAQLPMLVIYMLHLGVPAALPALLLAALGMGAFAVALGLFCGVVVGESGAGAAAGLAGGIAFLSFILFIFHGFAVTGAPSPMQETMLRVTALSPLALAIDGAGLPIFDALPAHTWRPLAGLAGLVAGLAGAAWVAYTRAQGPLGWEARGARSIVVALVALAILAPVATAEVSFRETGDDDDGYAYSMGENTQVAFVPRGAPIDNGTFGLRAFFRSDELTVWQGQEMDALVLLLVPEGTNVRGVRIEVEGSDALRVLDGGVLSAPDGKPDGLARAGEGWAETATEGPLRPVYRVPVALLVLRAEALLDSPALVEVHTQFVADGRALESHARLTLSANVEGASVQLLVAGAPLPLAALASVVTRKLRTR